MPNFKILHSLAMINAMAAIRISSTRPIRIELSIFLTIYCYVFCTIVVAVVFTITLKRLTSIILFKTNTFIGHFTYIFQVTQSALATSVMFFCQVIYRKDYMRLINKGLALYKLIIAEAPQTPHKNGLFDKYCIGLYKIRCQVTLFQLLILLIPLVVDLLNGEDIIDNIKFTFVLYTHIIRTIFGIMFFCSMLVILQFYRNVNNRIQVVVDRISKVQHSVKGKHGRMQAYCEISDELDSMTLLYDRVSYFLTEIVQFFGTQVLAELITAFTNILYGVRTSTNPIKKILISILIMYL